MSGRSHRIVNVPPEPLEPGANFFERIRYLVNAGEFLVVEALSSRHNQEHLMATDAELQVSLDRLTASTAAAGAAITSEIADLKTAVAALTPGDPITQAQLDQLNASADALDAATASLTADDAPTSTP